MAHHAHSVQRGLPVEQDGIAVHHVSMDCVANIERKRRLVHVSERDGVAIFLLEYLGSRPVVRSREHEAVQEVAVALIDLHRFGDVLSDLHGDPEFLDGDVGIGRDDGTRAKVYALGHEVAAHASALAVEPVLDGLERPTRALRHGGDAWDLVVYLCGDVIL